MCVAPQNSAYDERLSDIVIEGNRFFPGFGSQSQYSLPVQIALLVVAQNVTVRNNIFSAEGGSPDYYAAIFLPEGAPSVPSTTNWIARPRFR